MSDRNFEGKKVGKQWKNTDWSVARSFTFYRYADLFVQIRNNCPVAWFLWDLWSVSDGTGAVPLCHRWHRRDTSKTARAWKPAVRRWTEPWVGGNQAKRKRASSSLSWPQSKSGLVLRWSQRSSFAILIQVSIITFLWPGIIHLKIIPWAESQQMDVNLKKHF